MRTKFLTLLILASGFGLLAADALGARNKSSPEASYPIAKMMTSGADVWFEPIVSTGGFTLSYSGPDGVVRQEVFQAGEVPHISLTPEMPAGVYTYELRVIPLGQMQTRSGDDSVVTEQSAPDLVQNGSFHVAAGQVLSNPTGADQEALLDVVHADDVIIQGSLGVGLDSVVDQSFGFDTIRLSEDNTRIKFDDTSTNVGFPANDWQLTANDSASGGANYFSIDDVTGAKTPFKVTAGAPSNSFFMDSTGRVGFKTATPVLDLHVNTNNTPAFRLEQNSSGGFTAQTWDIAGNEANFFVRDVTGGSRLPFRIRPGAPTSSIDISTTGNVGIGTASPQRQLHIQGSDAVFRLDRSIDTSSFLLTRINASGTILKAFVVGTNASASNVGEFIINDMGAAGGGAGARRMTISNTGAVDFPGDVSGRSFTWTSSLAFKSNVQTLDRALDTVSRLRGVRFNWRESGEPGLGLIAEEVDQVIPEVVSHAENSGQPTGLQYAGLIAVLVEAVKAQQKTINEQQQALARQHEEFLALKAELERLKELSNQK